MIKKKQAFEGFTLIELLTVMIIIAVIAGFATLSIRNDPHRIIENSAKRFVDQFTLISEESALHGLDYGLRIETESYNYLQWDQLIWRRPQDAYLAQTMKFPEVLEVELILDHSAALELISENKNTDQLNDQEENIEDPPQILLLSSGEVTPFTLQLRSVNSDNYLEIKIDSLGRATVERIDVI